MEDGCACAVRISGWVETFEIKWQTAGNVVIELRYLCFTIYKTFSFAKQGQIFRFLESGSKNLDTRRNRLVSGKVEYDCLTICETMGLVFYLFGSNKIVQAGMAIEILTRPQAVE